MSREINSFFKGLVFGAIAGTVAGVLFAPKPGEETRKDIKKLTENLKKKATDVYSEAKVKVERKIKSLKDLGKKIDEKKYVTLVNEIVSEYQKKDILNTTSAKKLSTQLKKDWVSIKKAVAS